jgi:hypothetical protein
VERKITLAGRPPNPGPAPAQEAEASGPSRSWLIWGTVAVLGVVGLLGPATAAAPPQGVDPAKPAGNPRVTRAAFDKIQWQMPSNAIERILGKGESVDNCLVLDAMGSQPDDRREPYKRVELGLWMKWKGKDHTIYVQFGGPNVVKNPDGSYSVGPNTECSLVLFITERSPRLMRVGQRIVEVRDIQIFWRLGPRHGEIHHLGK